MILYHLRPILRVFQLLLTMIPQHRSRTLRGQLLPCEVPQQGNQVLPSVLRHVRLPEGIDDV
jgi:hypothetical protein